MIYLFTGSDTAKARARAFAWVAAARAKAPEAPYLRLGVDDITPGALEEVAQSQGLFFSKMLILLDDPFERADVAEAVLDALPQLAASENPIAVLAPRLAAARAKKLEAAASKVFAFDAAEKKAARGFNAPLVNALAARDGKALWKELVRARRAGDAPEMLHGLLHWKARDLMQKGSRAWTPPQARDLSLALIELLSDSRSGDLPLDLSLERFALALS